jgi:hypothetical protein
MWKRPLMFRWVRCALILSLVTVGCRAKPTPVVVRVYRNRGSQIGIQLDRRFRELNSRPLHVSSGREILIATIEPIDYKRMLRDQIGQGVAAQLVVLDSPVDAKVNAMIEREAVRGVNVCDAVGACPAVVPAFIPSWVLDQQELEASQVVLANVMSMSSAERTGAAP